MARSRMVPVWSICTAALLLTAGSSFPAPSRIDDEDVAREDFARLETLIQEIPEEETEFRIRRRAEAEASIREHAGMPAGAKAAEVAEHVKKCLGCRRLRTEARDEEVPWSHGWLYRQAAQGLLEHLATHPAAKTADAARFQLAECHRRLEETEEALELWGKAARAPDMQLAAQAHVRLADHHFAEKEYEKALPHFQAGAADSVDVDEKLRCRLHVGKCLSALGKGAEAKRVLTSLAREIPSRTPDREREKMRISALVNLEHPPRMGKRLGMPAAIAWYEKVYAEHRSTRGKIKKETPADERRVLTLRRAALEEGIRVNLQDWNGIDHPKILYTLKVILSEAGNPFGPDVIRELAEIGSPDALEPLVRLLKARQGGNKRAAILDAMIENEIAIDESIVERTLADRKEIVDVRAAAARAIAHRDSRQAVSILCGEIAEEPSGTEGARPGRDPMIDTRRVNEAIRDALAGMKSADVLKTLGEMARSRKVPVKQREVVMEALGRMGRPEAVDALLPVLEDPEVRIAGAAADALGRSGDPRAQEALLMRLREGAEESALLLGLLGGIGRLGPAEKDEEILLPYGTSRDDGIRVLAHALLRQTGGAAGRARLIAALGDEVPDVRWHAIRGLGQGPPSVEGVSALIARMPDEEEVRLSYQILRYLNRMTGARLGTDPEEWAKWWENTRTSYDPSSVRMTRPRPTGADARRTGPRYFTLEVTSKKVMFLLDTSGSMQAKITVPEGPMSTRRIRDKKINIAKQQLIKVLEMFGKDTSYNVLAFESKYTPIWRGIRSATRRNTAKAIKIVQGFSAAGGTNIFDTLSHALADRKVDTIYLLSDGEPTEGALKDPNEILKEIQTLNGLRRVKIHTIDLSGQSFFLNRLSKENDGRYVSVLYWE